MKTFTYSQKKWAMTGCLLLTLGFNLSVHKSTGGYQSVELASEAAEEKETGSEIVKSEFPTADGVVKVTYVKMGKDKVQAVITQGSICTACENSVQLDTKFTEDIAVLNVALLKALKNDKQVAVSDTSKRSEEDSEESQSEEPSFTEKKLAQIEKQCSRKSDDADSNNSELRCYSERFQSLFKSKDKLNLEKSELAQFFRENIESLVRAQIIDTRRMASGARHGSGDSTQDASEMRTEALGSLEQLISWIPAKYESVREGLIKLESKLLSEEAADTKAKFVAAEALKSTDPRSASLLLQEAALKRSDLVNLANGLDTTNQYARDRALRYDVTSEAIMDQYMKDFNTYKQHIISGMTTNPTGFDTSLTVVDSSGRIVGRIANGTGRTSDIQAIDAILTPDLSSTSGGGSGIRWVQDTHTPEELKLAQEQARLKLMQNQSLRRNTTTRR